MTGRSVDLPGVDGHWGDPPTGSDATEGKTPRPLCLPLRGPAPSPTVPAAHKGLGPPKPLPPLLRFVPALESQGGCRVVRCAQDVPPDPTGEWETAGEPDPVTPRRCPSASQPPPPTFRLPPPARPRR